MNFENEQKPRKKVGIALGGGFIRATAGIGVVEVLEENNIPIDIVSGCSSGTAVAGAYCVGTMDKLKQRLSKGKPMQFLQVIVEPAVPKKGIFKGERNRKFFEEFVGDKEFSDVDKKLIFTATNLASMKEVIISQGKIGKAIQACTAVPGIFVPVNLADKFTVDGANFNLIPSKPLYDAGADYVIAIYVAKDPSPITKFFANLKNLEKWQNLIGGKNKNICKKNMNIFQLVWRAFYLSFTQIKNFYHHAYDYDILIRPDIEGVKRHHSHAVDFCVEQGRKAALKALPQIKKDLGL